MRPSSWVGSAGPLGPRLLPALDADCGHSRVSRGLNPRGAGADTHCFLALGHDEAKGHAEFPLASFLQQERYRGRAELLDQAAEPEESLVALQQLWGGASCRCRHWRRTLASHLAHEVEELIPGYGAAVVCVGLLEEAGQRVLVGGETQGLSVPATQPPRPQSAHARGDRTNGSLLAP